MNNLHINSLKIQQLRSLLDSIIQTRITTECRDRNKVALIYQLVRKHSELVDAENKGYPVTKSQSEEV